MIDLLDLIVIGDVIDVMDNCFVFVDVQFIDQVNFGICEDEVIIICLWCVMDVCGNVVGKIQVINIVDLQSFFFNVLFDIMVDCSQVDDFMVMGEFINVIDDCDFDFDVDFSDDIFMGDCENEYMICCIWCVIDCCGQFVEIF